MELHYCSCSAFQYQIVPRRTPRPNNLHTTVLSAQKRVSVFEKFSYSTTLESVVEKFVPSNYKTDNLEMKKYLQMVTLLRVGVPSVIAASIAYLIYPGISMSIFGWINDNDAIVVVANDYSQYIQNILTTSGLMFSITVGYTYYFLYQQQEAIYLSLFEEVNEAKCLLEQVALVSQGRPEMYHTILEYIERYVQEDLTQFFVEPSILLSKRPIDDPLEQIMYLTSVGEPSIVYQTVRTLRQARAFRLGALQRKLPPIHFALVYILALNILVVFPLLGAGSQTIGGMEILNVQAIYMAIIVFGIGIVLGVLNELNQPSRVGAYNVVSVLTVMVRGLVEEIDGRQAGQYEPKMLTPTVDGLPRAMMASPSDDTLLYYND
jgi:Protein of unknown function (DUF4239)